MDVQLNRFRTLQKRAIRTITYSRYNDHASQHFRGLKIWKLNDIFKLQQLLFMHDFEKNQLPNGLNWLFQRIGNVHNRLTRLSAARGLYTQKFNTTTHGLSSLRETGTKALHCLKSDLLKKVKKTLITKYFVVNTNPIFLSSSQHKHLLFSSSLKSIVHTDNYPSLFFSFLLSIHLTR